MAFSVFRRPARLLQRHLTVPVLLGPTATPTSSPSHLLRLPRRAIEPLPDPNVVPPEPSPLLVRRRAPEQTAHLGSPKLCVSDRTRARHKRAHCRSDWHTWTLFDNRIANDGASSRRPVRSHGGRPRPSARVPPCLLALDTSGDVTSLSMRSTRVRFPSEPPLPSVPNRSQMLVLPRTTLLQDADGSPACCHGTRPVRGSQSALR